MRHLSGHSTEITPWPKSLDYFLVHWPQRPSSPPSPAYSPPPAPSSTRHTPTLFPFCAYFQLADCSREAKRRLQAAAAHWHIRRQCHWPTVCSSGANVAWQRHAGIHTEWERAGERADRADNCILHRVLNRWRMRCWISSHVDSAHHQTSFVWTRLAEL